VTCCSRKNKNKTLVMNEKKIVLAIALSQKNGGKKTKHRHIYVCLS